MTIFYTANYNDGTKFSFSEDDAGKGDYKKIDRTKLKSFEVYNDTKLLHRLHLEPGQRLIARRRVQKKISGNIKRELMQIESPALQMAKIREYEEQGLIPTIPIYLIGYQETIQGQNRQSITIIHQDGTTEMISAWKEEPLGPIQLLEEEKEAITCQ